MAIKQCLHRLPPDYCDTCRHENELAEVESALAAAQSRIAELEGKNEHYIEEIIGMCDRLRVGSDRIAELERMVVWCIRHEAGLAGDDDVYLMWGDQSIMLQDDDNGLAAVEKAMGGGK